MVSSPGPSNTIPGSLKPDSGDPETEFGSLETEQRVRRIHTWHTGNGITKDSPQPGGPHKGWLLDFSEAPAALLQCKVN